MLKNRLKLLIWLSLLALVVAAFFLVLTGAGNLIVYFSTGADPSSALNLIPAAPNDLEQRLHWLPEQIPDSPGYRSDFRPLEPFTRDKIAGAYLRAWSQWNISYQVGVPYGLKSYFSGLALAEISAAVTAVGKSGWEITQNDLRHNLLLTFYADDGQVVAFTDREASVVQILTPPDGGASQMIEMSGTYEVVMLLEDGNWRVRLWQRQDITAPPRLQPLQIRPKLVHINDGQLTLDGKSFDIAGVNYYPQAMPWEQFWAEYNPRLTSADLARVRSLGLNTVRIFIPFDQFGGGKPDEIYLARLANFLAQANTQRLKVIVTLFDHRTDHDPGNWAADDRYLAGLIPLFAGHPAILAWDVKNEPDRDYAANSPELTQAWLRHVLHEIRRYDRQHLLTIGWSTPAAARDLTEFVDIVSYHFYAPAADYPAQLATLQTAATGKPLLLQEFGLPTWNSIFPNGHTEAEQAAYYADLLPM